MSQTLKNLDIKNLVIDIIKCRIRKELNEKISAWKNGKAIVNIYDVTRCGYRYRLSIDNPGPEVDNIGKEDVFRRYIFNYGLMNIIKRAYEDEGAKIEENFKYILTIDDRELELVGICDIFLPKEKEIILVRHVKGLEGRKPKKHHVEQAIVLQWLAYKNGILAKPRILYYIGFGKEFREFTIDTNIVHSGVLVKEFEKRLVERLKLILGGEGPFNSWECDKVCPYNNYCGKKQSTNTKTSNIVYEGEWVWYEDVLLTRTMKFIRRLIEKDIEFAKSKNVDIGTSSNLRISVTALTECPIKFWFNTLVPYATILLKLNRRVLRGDIVHSGIAYIVGKINEVKQYCADISSISRCIKHVEVEKKLSKSFSVYGFDVEVSGRADIVLAYANNYSKNIVVELKTVEHDSKARPYHEEQLKIYLNMLKDSKGRLVYVTEDKEKTNSSKKRRVLRFNEIEIESPASDDHIKNRIEDIIKAREGLIDINKIAEKYKDLCEICRFENLCIARSSQAEHGTKKSHK